MPTQQSMFSGLIKPGIKVLVNPCSISFSLSIPLTVSLSPMHHLSLFLSPFLSQYPLSLFPSPSLSLVALNCCTREDRIRVSSSLALLFSPSGLGCKCRNRHIPFLLFILSMRLYPHAKSFPLSRLSSLSLLTRVLPLSISLILLCQKPFLIEITSCRETLTHPEAHG